VGAELRSSCLDSYLACHSQSCAHTGETSESADGLSPLFTTTERRWVLGCTPPLPLRDAMGRLWSGLPTTFVHAPTSRAREARRAPRDPAPPPCPIPSPDRWIWTETGTDLGGMPSAPQCRKRAFWGIGRLLQAQHGCRGVDSEAHPPASPFLSLLRRRAQGRGLHLDPPRAG